LPFLYPGKDFSAKQDYTMDFPQRQSKAEEKEGI
jgi:hypothetical protein